jgi:hypothetical protein
MKNWRLFIQTITVLSLFGISSCSGDHLEELADLNSALISFIQVRETCERSCGEEYRKSRNNFRTVFLQLQADRPNEILKGSALKLLDLYEESLSAMDIVVEGALEQNAGQENSGWIMLRMVLEDIKQATR